MPDASQPHDRLCLVTGATGYVGGRLVTELLNRGYRVRCMTRSADKLRDHPWGRFVEIAEADAGDRGAVTRALEGVDVAYYLIHAIGTGGSFENTDRRTAEVFATAAKAAGIGRLVYLGGIVPAGEDLAAMSPHLRSRAEVGEIMLASGVPTAVLRAAVIIGSGSASFEMLRYLTERLPAMITPRWVRNRIQPIAIRDVLRYLAKAAELPPDVSRGFDIGGPDVLTYQDMMQRYARAAGLPRRLIVPVNVLTPKLSSHWVGIVTPVPSSIARPLVESLRSEVVCSEHDIERWIPAPQEGLLGIDSALAEALKRIREANVETRWSSASVPGAPSDPLPTDPDWAGGSLYVDEREQQVDASPAALWRVIESIGGENGWYSLAFLWHVRGIADRLVGGVGLRRGRRDPNRLYVGESLDWWRVEERQPQKMLRLRAEMRLPGLAWLELGVRAGPPTVYTQRAVFHPHGLLGHLYWRAISPFHGLVFGGMTRNVARAAERLEKHTDRPGEADSTTVRRAAS
jgi:uncharacterized protein YbjT (DUF2867 family)